MNVPRECGNAGSRVRLVIDHDRLAMAGGKLDVARATLGPSINDVRFFLVIYDPPPLFPNVQFLPLMYDFWFHFSPPPFY